MQAMLAPIRCELATDFAHITQFAHLHGPYVSISVALRTDTPTAAIACGIAWSTSSTRVDDIPNAVEKACQYVEAGIHLSPELGHGNGPIGHFHSLWMQSPLAFRSSLRRTRYQGKAVGEMG